MRRFFLGRPLNGQGIWAEFDDEKFDKISHEFEGLRGHYEWTCVCSAKVG